MQKNQKKENSNSKKSSDQNAELLVHGARVHNLKNISVSIPRGSLAVFTGVSGSGKSSLAFDTIFAEGQRRYVESLSAYARQFLGQMEKPEVDFISGLSPAVSIDQKSTNRNPRSTVGTITEIYDYLRLLYARVGQQFCPVCGELIVAQSVQVIVDSLLSLKEGTRLQLLAPLVRGRKGEYSDLLSSLRGDGYSRVIIDGETFNLSDDIPELSKTMKHEIAVVVDRLVVKDDEATRRRFTDSTETTLNLSSGLLFADFVDEKDEKKKVRKFSQKRACPNDHPLSLDEIEPRTFSFNAPYGSCSECDGIGYKIELDPTLVIPNEDISINQGAIAPFANHRYYYNILAAVADELDFSFNTPWKDLPQDIQRTILYGKEDRISVQFRNRWGRLREYSTDFEGVINTIMRRYKETESQGARNQHEQYMREVHCPVCNGMRLNDEVLAVRINKLNISEFSNLSIEKAVDFVNGLTKKNVFSKSQQIIAAPILKEVLERLNFLLNVGLNYLTLSRAAGTLSGGEAQRIRLATQIGTGLVGVLYVLDEPSIGLHQRDNHKLIETLEKLRDLGNTLIVVEHDEDTIKASNWIVDIGPKAGINGGEVLYCAENSKDFLNLKNSLTADYLAKRKQIEIPKKRRAVNPKKQLKIVGAFENNLKNIDVELPLGVFCAITGVSGSGKSSLINSILNKALANKLNGSKQVPGHHKALLGAENCDKVINVDQGPIGRTPRSNPATYTGVWDKIRGLFSELYESKVRGYGPGRFSFNVKGGRCEECQGDGTVRIEMNFLPDVFVKCETCKGKRYNRETLEVKYNGKSVSDILEMTISEAAKFFEKIPAIAKFLDVLESVGLGYVQLGQSATTLSGGESQRVKLASELQRRSTGKTVYILDEPTTGLHFDDVNKLLKVLQSLVEKGNSVFVIEHNLDVIKTADYIIDMGPEGGEGGGTVVAKGTPEDLVRDYNRTNSHTAKFLKGMINA